MFSCSKKFISVLLCIVLIFTTASVAFAAEDNEEVFEKYYSCRYFDAMDFIVVTFESKYSQIGEKPEVQFYNSSDTFSITEDAITLKIFEYEGERYPQLFIKTENFDSIKGVVIGAGAFITESGEISGRVNISDNEIYKSIYLPVACEIEAFEIYEILTSTSYSYTTVGKPVEIVGYDGYGTLWLDEITATYTVNGKTVEINSNEFVPQEPGRYVVEFKFGDIPAKTLEFDVLSESDSYSKSLGNAIKYLILSPFYLLLSGVLLLIPGFGTILGLMFGGSVTEIIPNFFAVLFNGPVYYEYILY